MQSLTDQVAVITGAGQGIGRAVAEVLAAEGARVAIADVERDRAETTATELRGRATRRWRSPSTCSTTAR